MQPKLYNVLGFVIDCCGQAHLSRAPTISPHLTDLQLNIESRQALFQYLETKDQLSKLVLGVFLHIAWKEE